MEPRNEARMKRNEAEKCSDMTCVALKPRAEMNGDVAL